MSAGTLRWVPVRNSIQMMPASAAGRALTMMSGSTHDWKFTTISRYTSTIAIATPTPRPKNELRIVCTCAAHDDLVAARQWRAPPSTSCVDLSRDAAQIAFLDAHEEVDDGPDVVVRDDGELVFRLHVARGCRAVASARLPRLDTGVRSSSSIELTWILRRLDRERCIRRRSAALNQKAGAVCVLPDSEISTFCATLLARQVELLEAACGPFAG